MFTFLPQRKFWKFLILFALLGIGYCYMSSLTGKILSSIQMITLPAVVFDLLEYLVKGKIVFLLFIGRHFCSNARRDPLRITLGLAAAGYRTGALKFTQHWSLKRRNKHMSSYLG
jgi:hypothetical protein